MHAWRIAGGAGATSWLPDVSLAAVGSFSELGTPRTSAATTVRALLHDRVLLEAQVSRAPSPVASVRALLRTAESAIDRPRVEIAFQLRDAAGDVGHVDLSGLSATLTINHDEQSFGFAPQSAECLGTPLHQHATTHLVSCALDLPSSWFSVSGSASVGLSVYSLADGVAPLASASIGSVALRPAPAWYLHLGSTLQSAGMLITLPASPVFPGEQISMVVQAHTAGHALQSFAMLIYLDSEVFEQPTVESSALFNAPTVQITSGGAAVSVAAVGVQAGTTDAQVRGVALQLLTLRVTVRSDVASGWHTPAVRMRVLGMVNTGNFAVVSEANGTAFDSLTGLSGASQPHPHTLLSDC